MAGPRGDRNPIGRLVRGQSRLVTCWGGIVLNSDVAPDDRRLHAARLRQSMREIDAQMEQIRADDRPRRSRFVSWLLIPPALGAILLETLRPTRRRSARRARVAVVRDPEI